MRCALCIGAFQRFFKHQIVPFSEIRLFRAHKLCAADAVQCRLHCDRPIGRQPGRIDNEGEAVEDGIILAHDVGDDQGGG